MFKLYYNAIPLAPELILSNEFTFFYFKPANARWQEVSPKDAHSMLSSGWAHVCDFTDMAQAWNVSRMYAHHRVDLQKTGGVIEAIAPIWKSFLQLMVDSGETNLVTRHFADIKEDYFPEGKKWAAPLVRLRPSRSPRGGNTNPRNPA
jgi:hypothetical protein